MADSKISNLTPLTGINTAADDALVIVDTSAGETKKITLTEMQTAPISSGTANGIPYLNATKQLTSGTGLTFNGTNLSASNDAAINGLTIGKGGGNISSNTASGYQALHLNTTGPTPPLVFKPSISTPPAAKTQPLVIRPYSNTTGTENTASGFLPSKEHHRQQQHRL